MRTSQHAIIAHQADLYLALRAKDAQRDLHSLSLGPLTIQHCFLCSSLRPRPDLNTWEEESSSPKIGKLVKPSQPWGLTSQSRGIRRRVSRTLVGK
jgi:hypothetical protein